MSTWKERTLQLYESGSTWVQITEAIKDEYYPQLGFKKVEEKVRAYIRTTDVYKLQRSGTDGKKRTINADGTEVYERILNLVKVENASPQDIIRHHELDPLKWEVARYTSNLWGRDENGVPYYQSKLQVKPTNMLSTDALEEFFRHHEINYKPKILPRYSLKREGLTAVVGLVDVHFGLLAWGEETGENYDLKIARECVLGVIDKAIKQLSKNNMPIKKIIFPGIGNDFFHTDNSKNETAKGTRQDSDSRWEKVFSEGCSLLIEIIERLAQVAPVDAMLIKGNHDYETSVSAARVLFEHFRNYKNVTIDNSPKIRKSRVVGNTSLTFTHGDKEGKRISDTIEQEEPEIYKSTDRHIVLRGHKHQYGAAHDGNVLLYTLPTVTVKSAWTVESGYVGERTMHTLLFSDKEGLQSVVVTNVKD